MDVFRLREQFPPLASGDRIFLDNAATSLTPQSVISEVARYYRDYSVNVGRGAYRLAAGLTIEIEEARELVASFIGAQPQEIVFTANTSDSISKLASGFRFKPNDRVVTSILEHHSNLLPWRLLAGKGNIEFDMVPMTSSGQIDVEAFESGVKKGCRLAAVSAVSNVLGTVQPVHEMVRIAHQNGTLIALDAAQLVGHRRFDVKDLDCDFLAFSAHKIFGPTGIGVLYVREEIQNVLEPPFLGGGTVRDVTELNIIMKDFPHNFEPGTPNISGILGLAQAVRFIRETGLDKIENHVSALFNRMYAGLLSIGGVEVYTPESTDNVGIISFNIPGLTPHQCATSYDRRRKIMLRSGFHCAAPLVRQLGAGKGTVRASLAAYNTEEEVDTFLRVTSQIVEQA